jgi:hypothetical protein
MRTPVTPPTAAGTLGWARLLSGPAIPAGRATAASAWAASPAPPQRPMSLARHNKVSDRTPRRTMPYRIWRGTLASMPPWVEELEPKPEQLLASGDVLEDPCTPAYVVTGCLPGRIRSAVQATPIKNATVASTNADFGRWAQTGSSQRPWAQNASSRESDPASWRFAPRFPACCLFAPRPGVRAGVFRPGGLRAGVLRPPPICVGHGPLGVKKC